MSTTANDGAHCRGDVVLVLYPNADLRTAKRRPVLVVQSNGLNTGLSQVVVAMISSKVFRSGHPSRVLIEMESPEYAASGLLSNSVVMTDNLATIATCEIDRKIGALAMNGIDAALRHTLGL